MPMLNQLLPNADSEIPDAFTRLAYSYLSPRKVGATLLFSLTAPQRTDHQTAGTSIGALGLKVQRLAAKSSTNGG